MGNKVPKAVKELELLNEDDPGATLAQVNAVWDQFDTDKSGFLEKSEAEKFFTAFARGQGVKKKDQVEAVVAQLWEIYDVDKDGKISKLELLGEASSLKKEEDAFEADVKKRLPPSTTFELDKQAWPNMAGNSDGAVIAVAQGNGLAVIRNGEAPQKVVRSEKATGGETMNVAVSPDGRKCAAGPKNGVIAQWTVDDAFKSGETESQVMDAGLEASFVYSLQYNRDSSKLLACVGSKVVMFDANTGSKLWEGEGSKAITVGQGSCEFGFFAGNQHQYVVAGSNACVNPYLYHSASGKLVARFEAHEAYEDAGLIVCQPSRVDPNVIFTIGHHDEALIQWKLPEEKEGSCPQVLSKVKLSSVCRHLVEMPDGFVLLNSIVREYPNKYLKQLFKISMDTLFTFDGQLWSLEKGQAVLDFQQAHINGLVDWLPGPSGFPGSTLSLDTAGKIVWWKSDGSVIKTLAHQYPSNKAKLLVFDHRIVALASNEIRFWNLSDCPAHSGSAAAASSN